MEAAAEDYGITAPFTYLLGRRLGHGTFGTVHEAELRVQGAEETLTVAVKSARWSAKDGTHVTTLREIAHLRRLAHPNVVRLLAVCHAAASTDLVLECWDDDLHRFVGRSRRLAHAADFDWDHYAGTARPIMAELAGALAYCHAQGVVHRDVKPANVLLTPRLRVKLADFGAASTTNTDHLAHYGENTTLWYRAPEALLGDTLLTPAIDAWSLGIILMEMMALEAPLTGKTAAEQIVLVFEFAGYPTRDTWPAGVELLRHHVARKGPLVAPRRKDEIIAIDEAFDEAAEAAEMLLIPNPALRMTCLAAAHALGGVTPMTK